jgi:hypothetical protein
MTDKPKLTTKQHLWRMKSKRPGRKWPTFKIKKILPAAEKIGYTTLGILLALWINNCDEGRKKREIERKTLLEIRAGLEQDRRDLRETVSGYEYRVQNAEQIFDYLRREQPPADSLANRVGNLISFSYLLANTAAYETLKSRGLETITNDSLRLGIATLYDVEYEAIQASERHLDEINNGLFMPYLTTHIHLGTARFSEAEVEKMQRDRSFQQMLWQVKFLNQAVLERYQQALASLEKNLRDLEAELNRRRF